MAPPLPTGLRLATAAATLGASSVTALAVGCYAWMVLDPHMSSEPSNIGWVAVCMVAAGSAGPVALLGGVGLGRRSIVLSDLTVGLFVLGASVVAAGLYLIG